MTGTQSFGDALKALRDLFGRKESEVPRLDPNREALGSAAGLYVAIGIAMLLVQGVDSALVAVVLIQHAPTLILIALSAGYAAARQKSDRIAALLFFILVTEAALFVVSALLAQIGVGGSGLIVGLLVGLTFVSFRRIVGLSTGESIGVGLVVVVIVMGASIWLVTGTGAGRAITGI
jgi:hypothetical protein